LGGSDWHGAQVIHELIRVSPFAKDIHGLGFLSQQDLPDWYRAAGAFVFPSLFEGFGLPPVEAMACGCPVLSSTSGALAETIGNAAAPLEPENIGQMQAALTRVATDEKWRVLLRATGLEHARAFDWRTTAAATFQIYERAAARRKASHRSGSVVGTRSWNGAGDRLLGRTDNCGHNQPEIKKSRVHSLQP
jgi:glycosyltransferase involved in cell wall biosynthesis